MRFLPVLFTGGVVGVLRLAEPEVARPPVGDFIKCDDGVWKQVSEYPVMSGFMTWGAAASYLCTKYNEDMGRILSAEVSR